MILCDTNVIIEILKGNEKTIKMKTTNESIPRRKPIRELSNLYFRI